MGQSVLLCSCFDPTPVYRTLTREWFCYECYLNLSAATMRAYRLHPVRSSS